MKKLQQLLKERADRSGPDLLSSAFAEQICFIKDPARRKALFVARRSGKSYAIGIYLILIALSEPKIKCLYFGKTQYAAKNTMWLDIIFEILTKFNIKHEYSKTRQEITFNNNSIIKLTGADAKDTQIEVALGGKYKLVVFDECQVITHDLERWIKFRLGPAMIDNNGIICMCGTAGDYMGDRFWYKVTKPIEPEPGWSVHHWHWSKNIHMKALIQEELDRMKTNIPGIETTPLYRQEWVPEWVIETSSRIYKYNSDKNKLIDAAIIKSLLEVDKKWKFILGVDPGFEDATGFVIAAYTKHDPNFYIVEAKKIKKLHATAMATEIIALNAKYHFSSMIVDGANKQVVEECRQIHRIPLIAADKLGKVAHWGLMNADFLTSRIKVIEDNCRGLIKEWNELTYIEKDRLIGILKESPTNDNHEADAALYAWFYSRHYRATPEPIIDDKEARIREAERMYNNKSIENVLDQYDAMYEGMNQ